jgi:thiol-disulfide isomerase/thioredoxin
VGALVAIAALVVAAALGLAVRRVNGRFRAAPSATDPVLADLGVISQTPLTLLQFSSAFCAPCRVTRVLCADLAARMPGVHHIDVDAESHVDAVRALNVWRTPTVLLIDGEGRIRQRASGATNRTQLWAAAESVLGKGSLAA